MATQFPATHREQIDYWNGVAAERWLQNEADTDRALAPFGAAAEERLAPPAGAAVLDVGCGTGETLLRLSRRVGPAGSVVGIDVSRPLLARAAERTRALGNVELIEADAAAHAFDRRFDGVFSRFGVMFFADAVQAFSHLRQASAPGGRLAFACWQAIEKNPWAYVPLLAARTILKEPQQMSDPEAPGPFAFARAERVREILERAGYGGVAIEAFQAPVQMAEDGIEAAVSFASRIGPVARMVAEQPESVRLAVWDQLRTHLVPFVRDGRVALDGLAWVVSARAT